MRLFGAAVGNVERPPTHGIICLRHYVSLRNTSRTAFALPSTLPQRLELELQFPEPILSLPQTSLSFLTSLLRFPKTPQRRPDHGIIKAQHIPN